MKIGIMTFHNADNYGAVLQCYALQEKLKELYPNDEVYVVDYKCPKIEKFYVRKFIILKPWSIIYFFKSRKKHKKFQDFRTNYLNIGPEDFSKYDLIIYGSDQIWNPCITGRDLTYFGKYFNGEKIAYAVSDGGEMKYDSEVYELLNKFSKISCREKSITGNIKKQNLQLIVSTVCDPVFLLSKDKWLKIAELPKEQNYILTYKVKDNVNFDLEAEKLGRKLNKKVIQIVYVKPLRMYFYKGQHIVEGVSPEQFLGYIVKADYVLTTSFHATAFSIIFEKPFFVLEIDSASERITDLLSELQISDRYGKYVQESKQMVENLESYVQNSCTFLNS